MEMTIDVFMVMTEVPQKAAAQMTRRSPRDVENLAAYMSGCKAFRSSKVTKDWILFNILSGRD